jgi:hypothetical protein
MYLVRKTSVAPWASNSPRTTDRVRSFTESDGTVESPEKYVKHVLVSFQVGEVSRLRSGLSQPRKKLFSPGICPTLFRNLFGVRCEVQRRH